MLMYPFVERDPVKKKLLLSSNFFANFDGLAPQLVFEDLYSPAFPGHNEIAPMRINVQTTEAYNPCRAMAVMQLLLVLGF
jgi:hypothetical protein